MAIGKTGGFASVTAPNVDFGAMTERFVDKELARDAANQAKRDAKKKAEEEAKLARRSELKEEFAEAKATNRSMYDVSVRKEVKKQRDLATQYKNMYESTGNPKYKEMFENTKHVVSNIANSTEAVNKLLTRVADGVDNDLYNSEDLERFDAIATNLKDGKYKIFTDEQGNPMVTFFDTDPNDDINNERTMPFSDVLKEPLVKSKLTTLINTFVDKNDVDDITETSGLTTTQIKERTDRLDRNIDKYADKLSNNPVEFANWYIDNKGGQEAYYDNKGSFTQDDFREFKEYIGSTIRDAYPNFKKVTKKQPKQSVGSGGSVISDDSSNRLNIDRVIQSSGGGNSVSKGASSMTPSQEKGKGLWRKGGGTSSREQLLLGYYYDQNGLKAVTEEIVDDSLSLGSTISYEDDNGQKRSGKVTKNAKREKVIKRVIVGDINSPEIQNWLAVTHKGQDYRKSVLRPLYNQYVSYIRDNYSQASGLEKSTDVIKWAKKNIDKSGNLVEGKGETNEERKIRLGLK